MVRLLGTPNVARSGLGFQPGGELIEVLDLGRDGRADEDAELEPRELADGTKSFTTAGQKAAS